MRSKGILEHFFEEHLIRDESCSCYTGAVLELVGSAAGDVVVGVVAGEEGCISHGGVLIFFCGEDVFFCCSC